VSERVVCDGAPVDGQRHGHDLPPKPSVATRGTGLSGDVLGVYGKPTSQGWQLMGRFLRFRYMSPGAGLGAPFLIQNLPTGYGIADTDVIYNQQSQQFIVGYYERNATNSCRIKNVVVSGDEPPVIGTPAHRA
jgi:hypothetical protein